MYFVKLPPKCFILPDALVNGIALFSGCPTEDGINPTLPPPRICLNVETDDITHISRGYEKAYFSIMGFSGERSADTQVGPG